MMNGRENETPIKIEIDICKTEPDDGYESYSANSSGVSPENDVKPQNGNVVAQLKTEVKDEPGQEDVQYRCEQLHCQYSTSDINEYRIHITAHVGWHKFQCPECTYTSKRMVELKRHMYRHSSKTPHRCAQCNYRTYRVDSLRLHCKQHTIHGSTSSFELHDYNDKDAKKLANIQSETESKKSAYNEMSKSENESNKLSDKEMPKSENESNKLSDNEISKSENESKKSAYKEMSKSENESRKSIKTEKIYNCDKCGYRAGRFSYIKRHMVIHSTERPFSCTKCQNSFKRSEQLLSHMRRGHGQDRYVKCDACDYQSSDHSDLKKHYRIHTGDAPYRCKCCDYKAKQSGGLKQHMKRHHASE